MDIAQILKATLTVGETVNRIENKVEAIDNRAASVERLSSNLVSADYRVLPILSGNRVRKHIRKWLSPPDPSMNHHFACRLYHKETSWLLQHSIFKDWKSTGSLLWIHGKSLPRPLTNLTLSNSILLL
jgi:hypothetical protein